MNKIWFTRSLTIFLFAFVTLIFINSCQPEVAEILPIEISKDSLSISDVAFQVPQGFELEELFETIDSVEGSQGSWVSIAEAPNNTFYTCNQYGGIYKFQMPEVGGRLDPTQVDSLELNIGRAQGLLWAFNSLYVVVVHSFDEDRPDIPTTGVYKVTDKDNDGNLDDVKQILALDGRGEHGPHTLRVSPDGKSLYFIAGNFNSIPKDFKSRVPKNWDEDNLFPKYLDGRGHATDLKAPGGWMAKTDPDGEEWEILGVGMRNPFSFGINKHGDILAYDADMEYDFGMPWYRPTRILHVISGAEFGWRTGSGKWPVFYPDNLSAVENMSQGSPTAVIMGRDLNFPSMYKDGLFACDWSFGTVYFVDIQEKGSSYTGTKTEFLSGVPLPITNAIAGSDGHLYFLTGGRRLASRLYRLRYTGDLDEEVIATESSVENAKLRGLRHSLAAYHGVVDKNAISEAWPHLDHEDEFIRHTARIALEHQPLSSWKSNLETEEDQGKILNAGLAYARVNGPLDEFILGKLSSINASRLSNPDMISLSRVYELLLIRQGRPNTKLSDKIISHIDSQFPSNDAKVNRTLSQVLLYLNAPKAVDRSIALLDKEAKEATSSHPEVLQAKLLERSEKYGPRIAEVVESMPPTEAMHYVTILSHVKEGWTRELRTKYFDWFFKALDQTGGMSYKLFLDNIRAKALGNVSEEDYEYFKNMSGYYSPMQEMANLAQPKGPGRDYIMGEVNRIISRDSLADYSGTIKDGENAYEAALCSSCHSMHGKGGGSGPDLSNINTRFNKGEIVNAIVNPNEEISDQFAFTLFNLKDGMREIGSIVDETDDSYSVFKSPFDMTQISTIEKSKVESKTLSSISPMPAKLVNRLNADEIRDLFVYLQSGADPKHELYNK